jgi:DNA-binding GntR family transcriptional regulator
VTIDPDSATPLYEQLADLLRRQITTGELPVRRLPAIKTLAQTYSVSRGTAERAIRILRDEGLVRTSLGRGIFVAPREKDH